MTVPAVCGISRTTRAIVCRSRWEQSENNGTLASRVTVSFVVVTVRSPPRRGTASRPGRRSSPRILTRTTVVQSTRQWSQYVAASNVSPSAIAAASIAALKSSVLVTPSQ